MPSKWNVTQWVSSLLVAGVVLLSANQARATIIGLDDGTYDVALTCLFSDCAPNGPLGPFTGTLTVVGNDVTAWSFVFPATVLGYSEEFDGNPVEFIDFFGNFENARGVGLIVPAFDELVLRTSFGSPTWDLLQGGLSVSYGTWTAVSREAPVGVPEPSSAILFLSGLVALGLYFTRVPLRRS